MTVAVAAGDRLPADGVVLGRAVSDMDRSLADRRDARPRPSPPGSDVHAGELNLTGAAHRARDGGGQRHIPHAKSSG